MNTILEKSCRVVRTENVKLTPPTYNILISIQLNFKVSYCQYMPMNSDGDKKTVLHDKSIYSH